jgi:subtilisin family serine protease
MIRQLLAAALCVAAVSAHAERVRVIVAVDEARYSTASVSALRGDVIQSLRNASEIDRWGEKGRAFAVEIDSSEVEALRRDPRVRAITIDDGGRGALIQSIAIIGADRMHDLGYDGSGVTVAVVDTGIDAPNADFAGRIVEQRCWCDNLDGTGCCPNGETMQSGPGAARDDHGHGTHVAGILASGGASAPKGVAPRAKIVAIKVMDANNSFRSFTQIYRALEWIATSRPDVRVINMSLGSYHLFAHDACEASAVALGMKEVIALLRARGVLITASSGNEGSLTGATFPACMKDVVGVGATYDSTDPLNRPCVTRFALADQVTCFTNSGDAIDIVAPGADIVASRRGGGWTMYVGTSMAAPHVAGAIALMQQVSGGMQSADTLELILKQSGRLAIDPRDWRFYPRLDVAAAIEMTPRVVPPSRRRSVGR